MSLPKERKRSLNLDKDLVLTKEDLAAIETSQPHDPRDLGSYLDFLDEVWGSERKGIHGVNSKQGLNGRFQETTDSNGDRYEAEAHYRY